MTPIYFRHAQPDGTLGYRVIWPAKSFLDVAHVICFVKTEDEAKAVVEWLSEGKKGDEQ